MSTINKKYYIFGTMVTIVLEGSNSDFVLDLIVRKMYELQTLFSLYNMSSDISRINQQRHIAPVIVRKETYILLQLAQKLAIKTNYAFNPFLGHLSELLRQDIELSQQPPPRVQLEFIETNQSVFLPTLDAKLDLGGIAKGFVADTLYQLLRTIDCTVFINLGGHIMYCDLEKQERSHQIQIQDPTRSRGLEIATIKLPPNHCIVTSGIYERIYRFGHHIIHTDTGAPTNTNIMSATILTAAHQNTIADALATALIVLGVEQSVEFMRLNYPTWKYLLIDHQCNLLGNLL